MILNLPEVITFANGNTVTYVYDAAGSKLSVTYQTSDGPVKMDYAGNKVYNNGKELDRTMNLDLYDFHWRQYMADIGRTTTMDPHAENYYSLSSYSMFANNPVNVIDPTGMDTVYVAHDGHMDYRRGGENDIVYVTNKRGNVTSRTYGLGTLQGGGQRNLKEEGPAYAYLSVNNKENSKDIFDFLADNTSVEFGNSTFRNGDGSMSNYITTSHETGVESGFAYLSIDNELYNSALLSYDHSHPDGTPYPSGMPDSRNPITGDIPFAKGHVKRAITNLRPIPTFRIYVPGKGYRKYHINSTLKQFQGMPDNYWEK